MLVSLAGAGLDEINLHPREWGSGGDALAVRFASHFGQTLVKQHIAYAVRAMDHEDPRFELSHKKRISERIKYAVMHTYVVRNDSGKLIPAYSRFVSSYGAALISRQWWLDVIIQSAKASEREVSAWRSMPRTTSYVSFFPTSSRRFATKLYN